MMQISDWSGYVAKLSAFAPDWAVASALLVGALVVAHFVYRFVFRALRRLVAERDLLWRSIVSRTERLIQFGLYAVGLALASTVAPFNSSGKAIAAQGFLILVIILAGMATQTVLHIWLTVYLRRFKLDAEDNLLARKHVTQMRILRRILNTLIVVIVISSILMTFPNVRQYGVSLLASAGAAGIVAGLALQPFLKNLFAGIQLAITQPIRIEDALLVEGEWGNVEEITSTYVVVRIWDLRRLVLPLSYFIEQPFQNWTREQAQLIGSIILYLDYRAPIDAIRAEVEKIAKATPLWDKQVLVVQVTDTTATTIVVRILASAKNSSTAWDLRCHIREKVITFLQDAHPEALPRTRALLDAGAETAWTAAAAAPLDGKKSPDA